VGGYVGDMWGYTEIVLGNMWGFTHYIPSGKNSEENLEKDSP
jgi:hypothetical protein